MDIDILFIIIFAVILLVDYIKRKYRNAVRKRRRRIIEAEIKRRKEYFAVKMQERRERLLAAVKRFFSIKSKM